MNKTEMIMKSKVVVLMALIFAVCLPFRVHAEDKNYILSEEAISVDIPEEYFVVTKDTVNDEATKDALDEMGYTTEDVESMLETTGNCLDCLDYDDELEILINVQTADQISYTNFDETEDADLEQFGSEMEESFKDQGMEVSGHEIYSANNHKYVKISYAATEDGNDVHACNYIHYESGKLYAITAKTTKDEISESQSAILDKILGTLEFDFVMDDATFNDADGQVILHIPAGWQQTEFLSDKVLLKAKFRADDDQLIMVMYGSKDIWDELEDEEKEKYGDRSGLSDNVDLVEALTGLGDGEVEKKTYGGKTYYEGAVTTDGVTMHFDAHIENGWFYMLEAAFDPANSHYEDYLSFLETAEYYGGPAEAEAIAESTDEITAEESGEDTSIEDTATEEADLTDESTDEEEGGYGVVMIAIVVVIIALLVFLIGLIVVIVMITRKKPEKKNAGYTQGGWTAPTPVPAEKNDAPAMVKPASVMAAAPEPKPVSTVVPEPVAAVTPAASFAAPEPEAAPTPAPASKPAPAPAHIPATAKWRFCPECGTKLEEGAKFCVGCGHKLG